MFIGRSPSLSALRRIFLHLEGLQNWFAFQINESSHSDAEDLSIRPTKWTLERYWNWLEVLAVFCVFFVLTASFTPGVNESHYLTKAKHFWNPEWCGKDLFLASSDAHLFFFVTCGWPTLFLSLDAVAWVGRIGCCLAAAIAWWQLNRTMSVRPMYSIVSATMFILLVERFDLAGEWVLGGFEAKSVAYVFVLWAIHFILQRNAACCFAALGGAIAFHAVVGIWASICLFSAGFIECLARDSIENWRKNSSQISFAIGIGLLLSGSCLGCVPPLLANWNTAPQIVAEANAVQVHERLSHHLLFGTFKSFNVACFASQVLLFILMFGFTQRIEKIFRVNLICIASLLISLIGIFLSGMAEEQGPATPLANSLLRFYWFRFSDFTVPLALSLSATFFAGHLIASSSIPRQRAAICSLICLGTATILILFESYGDWRSGADRLTLPSYPGNTKRTAQTYENWRKACSWVRYNTDVDSLFLTPYHFQTFKWYAHRAEFACWKDIPQDAENIVIWRRRILDQKWVEQGSLNGWLGLPAETLAEFLKSNQISHVLAFQSDADRIQVQQDNAPSAESPIGSLLRQIYPAEAGARTTFVIYEVNN